jgi:3-hydroxyacyl-[acyl-carrier-protein] dehydratase
LLIDNLYTIQSVTKSEQRLDIMIGLKADHSIFKGHFPEQPVLPGVCMMEMICEIISAELKKEFRIVEAPVVKFLSMIDPNKNPVINLEINVDELSELVWISGKIYFEKVIFMKYRLALRG